MTSTRRAGRVRGGVVTVAAATCALLASVAAPARAAEQQAYAAALNYATPAVVAGPGDTLRFNNLDSLAQHDLVSDQPGLFASKLVAGGSSATVDGVASLAAGSYPFHCSLHPWMRGELTVAPVGGGLPPLPGGSPSGGGPSSTPNPADLMPHVPAAPLGPSAWGSYGGDLSNSRDGGVTAPSYNEVPTMGPVWTFHSADGDFTGTPVVSDGTLVAVSGAGTVYALDAATGALRWSRALKLPVNGSAAIAGGRVFVPLAQVGRPQVAALRLSDGALLWQTAIDTQTDADIFSSPVVWNDPAAGSPARPAAQNRPASRPAAKRRTRHVARRRHRARRRRRAHRHRSVRRRRTAPRRRAPQRPRTAGHGVVRAAAATAAGASGPGDTVYIGTSAEYGEVNDPNVHARGSVVALDAASGAIRWKTWTVPPGDDGGSVWSTPAIDPATGRLFVGTGNAYHPPAANTTDSILALDAHTGAVTGHLQATANDVWNETAGKGSGPDYDFGASPNLFTGPGGVKLVGEGQKSGTYWAVDRATMRPLWSAPIGAGSPVVGGIVGSTAADGARIYGPDTTAGEIWALGTDGHLAWASSDGGPLQFGAVSVGNGVVWSTDMSTTLTAREATTGAVLAKLPLGSASWGGVAVAGGSVFAVTGTQGTGGWVVAYRPAGG